MKTLIRPEEMQLNKVYNLVYVGDNEAYAKINGKRTIRVTATEPNLQYVELYDNFGSPTFDDLPGSTTYVGNPSEAFKEDEITEPADETEWFKKSVKFSSLVEAVEAGVLTPDDIKSLRVRSSSSPFVSVSNRAGKFIGLYTGFNVEGKTTQPYLQQVYIWWNTWEDMYADFEAYGVNASGRKKFFLTLKRTWEVADGAKPGTTTTIGPGRHEFVKVPNPRGHKAPWLVLKGTLIGACEGFWRDWQNGDLNEGGQPIDWGDFEVIVEELEW